MARTRVGAQVSRRFPPQLGAASTLLVGCLSHASGLPCGYTSLVIDPPDLPGWINESIALLDVNDAGVAVGRVTPLDDLPCLWSASTGVVLLPLPPGAGTAQATAINNDGWILVNGEVAGDKPQGYVYIPSGNGWTIVQIPWTWSTCWASGINDLGEVVGWYRKPVPGGGPGELVDIGYRWTLEKGMEDVAIPGWNATRCVDINNAGVICGSVGQSSSASGDVAGAHGMVLEPDKSTIIAPPPGFSRFDCRVVNESGTVGGRASIGGGTQYKAAGLLIDLADGDSQLVVPPAGWQAWVLQDLNASGTACGILFKPIATSEPSVADGGIAVALAELAPPGSQVGLGAYAIGHDGCIFAQWNASVLRFQPLASEGDLDCDGAVGASDLAIMIAAWGLPDTSADLDGSRCVDGADLGMLLASWDG